MKKILVCLIFTNLLSCSKDKASQPTVSTPCDTVPKSYSKDVAPIFAQKCTICHQAGSPSGGYVLESYLDYKQNIEIVQKATKHQPGAVPMPYQQAKLMDSLIQIIDCWIANGALND